MMTADILIILFLILLGVFLILLEVFFLPGITIAGIGAVLFLAGAVYYAFAQIGSTAGFLTLAACVIASLGGIGWFIRSKSLDRMALKTDIDSVATETVSEKIRPGDRGTTLTRLNPIGKAEVNGIITEARAIGNFIDEDCIIIVEKINKTNIDVRREEDENPA